MKMCNIYVQCICITHTYVYRGRYTCQYLPFCTPPPNSLEVFPHLWAVARTPS